MAQLAYYSFGADVKPAVVQITTSFPKFQLAYHSFGADVKPAVVQITTSFPKFQLAYHSFGADVKVSSIPYPSVELYLKSVYNPILFAFAGKAFLFDGSKLEEFGSPVTAIYPMLTSVDRILVAGGMREDSTVEENVYGFGLDSYFITADRDYLAVVIPSDTVYVIDEAGNVVQTTRQLSVVPLLRNWKLVSRKPFTTVVQRLL